MRNKIQALLREDEGATLLLVALMMAVLLGISALVIDGGMLYATKSHLQKAANAAVLSGAQELTNQESGVRSVITEVLARHQEDNHVISTTIQMDDKVTVELQKEVPMGLARLFGITSAPVKSKASAEILTMGAAMGAAPIGIDESKVLVYGQEYRLKVDNDLSTTGNFGIIALGDSAAGGADSYEKSLEFGFKGLLSVGDLVDTKTGNVAGATRDAVQSRLNRSPYTQGDTSHRDDSRILLVPVYKACPQNAQSIEECKNYQLSGQLKRIAITGFAYFYLTAPMDNSTKEVLGIFIERTGTGFSKPGAVNRGAYAIRLTE